MIPTTIEVAAVRPIERRNSVDIELSKAARFYHALLVALFAVSHGLFSRYPALTHGQPKRHTHFRQWQTWGGSGSDFFRVESGGCLGRSALFIFERAVTKTIIIAKCFTSSAQS
jgi:hypothetical protein